MLLWAAVAILAQVPSTSKDLATASLDELIARLPVVGFESRFDEDTRSRVLDPACEELGRRLASGIRLTDDQWRAALLGTEAVRSRERWPEEVPLAVSMRVPEWLPLSQITATPRQTGWPAARAGKFVRDTCANCRRGRQFREGYQELGRLDPGRHEVVFDVTVEQVQGEGSPYEKPPPPVSLWNGSLSLAVEVVTDRNTAFVPVS